MGKDYAYDGYCVQCGRYTNRHDIAFLVTNDTQKKIWCLCEDCFAEVITINNVMDFAYIHDDSSVWTTLYTYNELVSLAQKDFREVLTKAAEPGIHPLKRQRVEQRLREYVDRIPVKDFIKFASPCLFEKIRAVRTETYKQEEEDK